MDQQAILGKIKESVEAAKTIAIILPKNPTIDAVGSALSLCLGLSGLEKKVSVVCPDTMTVMYSNFIGVDTIQKELATKKNFVISLDYQEGSIDKVSYNIEGNKFNLVIEPRPGFEGFSEDQVTYTHKGGAVDLLFTVGMSELEACGEVYEKEKELLTTTPTINIDIQKENTLYGTTNLVDEETSSITELIAVVMSFVGVKLTEDIATNLFNAIDDATDHFQAPRVGSRTFEVASVCLKAGAKRFSFSPHQTTPVAAKEEPKEIKQGEVPDDFLKPNIFHPPTE